MKAGFIERQTYSGGSFRVRKIHPWQVCAPGSATFQLVVHHWAGIDHSLCVYFWEVLQISGSLSSQNRKSARTHASLENKEEWNFCRQFFLHNSQIQKAYWADFLAKPHFNSYEISSNIYLFQLKLAFTFFIIEILFLL